MDKSVFERGGKIRKFPSKNGREERLIEEYLTERKEIRLLHRYGK
jgi:hypothetical protein